MLVDARNRKLKFNKQAKEEGLVKLSNKQAIVMAKDAYIEQQYDTNRVKLVEYYNAKRLEVIRMEKREDEERLIASKRSFFFFPFFCVCVCVCVSPFLCVCVCVSPFL